MADVPVLRSVVFRREREPAWRALDALVRRVEQGGALSLGPAELARLAMLYRAAVSSLSVARAISLDRNVLEYLEALAARAYIAVYGAKRRPGEALAAFVRAELPTAVRRHAAHVGVAAACVLLGGCAGFALTLRDAEHFWSLVPADLAAGRDPGSSTADLRSVLYGDGGSDAGNLSAFAAFLFAHNARVGLMAFAVGFAGGIPTVALLLTNGLVLGAFAALYHARGLGLEFWGWVLPHGVTELLAVVLCGAAGLALGQAVIAPGRSTRLANLRRAGREAGRLVVGAVAMLLLAGLVEGIFRQVVHDTAVRYGVAVGSAIAWAVYFAWAGRP